MITCIYIYTMRVEILECKSSTSESRCLGLVGLRKTKLKDVHPYLISSPQKITPRVSDGGDRLIRL